jgi:hypothetical protein
MSISSNPLLALLTFVAVRVGLRPATLIRLIMGRARYNFGRIVRVHRRRTAGSFSLHCRLAGGIAGVRGIGIVAM